MVASSPTEELPNLNLYYIPHSTPPEVDFPPDPCSPEAILIIDRGSPGRLRGEVITGVSEKGGIEDDSLGLRLKTGLLLLP